MSLPSVCKPLKYGPIRAGRDMWHAATTLPLLHADLTQSVHTVLNLLSSVKREQQVFLKVSP